MRFNVAAMKQLQPTTLDRRHFVALALVVALGLIVLPRVGVAHAAASSIRPKVLVLTMFDAETAPWLAGEKLTRTISVPAMSEPLHCDANSALCVATIGEAKVNAATSMSAMLNDRALDLSHSYFITSGIAGTSPTSGTLGFAAWADWAVDYDQGHHVSPETDPAIPHGYLKGQDTGTDVYRLNPSLVREAYTLTKNIPLADSAEAAQDRAHYPGQQGRKPFVTTCATLTGDDYWAGKDASATANYIAGQWTSGAARYCTTQQEDNATAGVLQKYGLLDHYLSLRTASDFDQPYAGESATDLLAMFPGFTIATENAYRVASTMAHHLIKTAR